MSASDMQVSWALSEDRTKAILLIAHQGVTMGHIILDAPELDHLIQGLGTTRANMAEAVVENLDPGARLLATINPAWQTRPPHERDGVVLAIRNPGLGWLGHLLPPHEARAMGQSLLDLSQGQLSPEPTPPPPSTPE